MLIRIAGVRTIIMPYGSDVQHLDRNPTARFREALRVDYPGIETTAPKIRNQVQRWSTHGDVVINGCDWIDYFDRRDVLTLGHFALDCRMVRGMEQSKRSVFLEGCRCRPGVLDLPTIRIKCKWPRVSTSRRSK